MDVKSGHALLEVLSFAAGQRVSCSTLKNMDSSRSHAFYRLYMTPAGGAPCCNSIGYLQMAVRCSWPHASCPLQPSMCPSRCK